MPPRLTFPRFDHIYKRCRLNADHSKDISCIFWKYLNDNRTESSSNRASLVALATVGAPALARAIHQPATQDSQQMYTGPDVAWSWPVYQRDGVIIAFARPDLAVTGSGLSSAAPVVDTASIALSSVQLLAPFLCVARQQWVAAKF